MPQCSITVMAGSSPHQTSPHQAESANVCQQDEFLNLEREKDRENYQEGSMHTVHTDGSSFRRKGRVAHGQGDEKALQREIDDLKKQLRRPQQKRSLSSSDVSSNEEEDTIYRQRSRTPPSESFSCEEEHFHQRKCRSPSYKGVGIDVMKKALSQISKSPFTRGIEKVKLPRRFHQPTFAMYNGRTDPVEHVSQFKQKMAVHSQDEALMCRVFPSNLRPMPMRWFDGLKINSINSFKKLTQSFCSRFITCSRVPQPLDFLLSMSMKEGESAKTYSERYWEMFNEIDGDSDEVAIKTFKVGLPSEHGLRKSLIGKSITSLCQLMDRVDKYKRIEDD